MGISASSGAWKSSFGRTLGMLSGEKLRKKHSKGATGFPSRGIPRLDKQKILCGARSVVIVRKARRKVQEKEKLDQKKERGISRGICRHPGSVLVRDELPELIKWKPPGKGKNGPLYFLAKSLWSNVARTGRNRSFEMVLA